MVDQDAAAQHQVSWKRSTCMQRKLIYQFAQRWLAWLEDLECAPDVPAAFQLLLGMVPPSFKKWESSQEVDSGWRPILPRGSLCRMDVEEIALPDLGKDGIVDLCQVCPAASYYFDNMESLMLKSAADLDMAAY